MGFALGQLAFQPGGTFVQADNDGIAITQGLFGGSEPLPGLVQRGLQALDLLARIACQVSHSGNLGRRRLDFAVRASLAGSDGCLRLMTQLASELGDQCLQRVTDPLTGNGCGVGFLGLEFFHEAVDGRLRSRVA